MNNRAQILHTTVMKKFYLSFICTAALIAAIGFAGCSDMGGGKQTTQRDIEVTQQQVEDCPDGECPEDTQNNGKNGECPDGKCPNKNGKGKKGRHGKFVMPKERFSSHRRKPKHPKLPVQPPEDDVIIPDPPVEQPQH